MIRQQAHMEDDISRLQTTAEVKLKNIDAELFFVGVKMALIEDRLDMIELQAKELVRDVIRKVLEYEIPETIPTNNQNT